MKWTCSKCRFFWGPSWQWKSTQGYGFFLCRCPTEISTTAKRRSSLNYVYWHRVIFWEYMFQHSMPNCLLENKPSTRTLRSFKFKVKYGFSISVVLYGFDCFWTQSSGTIIVERAAAIQWFPPRLWWFSLKPFAQVLGVLLRAKVHKESPSYV